jgi:hypothetical protein
MRSVERQVHNAVARSGGQLTASFLETTSSFELKVA